MREGRERAKRRVRNIYSWAADRVYDPVVINGAFRVFGGSLNDLVREQGRAALASADGGPILDMPVGTAYFASEVARSYEGLVVGVDIAEGMVREARRVTSGTPPGAGRLFTLMMKFTVFASAIPNCASTNS